MLDAFKKLFTSAHRDYAEVASKFTLIQLIGLSILVSIAVAIPTILASSLDFSAIGGQFSQLGLASGFAISGISYVLGILLCGIPLLLVFYIIYIFLVKFIAGLFGANIPASDILKAALLASIPASIVSIVQALLTLVNSGIRYISYDLGTLLGIGFGFLYIFLGLAAFVYYYYIFVNALKTTGKMDSTGAVVTGCLPSIIIAVSAILIAGVCIIVFILLIGAAAGGAAGSTGTIYNF